MGNRSVAIAGFPSAGKTTYLAAFWYLLFSRKVQTKISFDSVAGINTSYLDQIRGRWLDGYKQLRSVDRSGSFITLKLYDQSSQPFELSFPDLTGEIFRDMWEQRHFPEEIAEKFRDCAGLVFFIDGNNIQKSPLLSDIKRTRDSFGEQEQPEDYKPWHPSHAHTQAKVVELLQMFSAPPVNLPSRKLSIVFSCWDKIDANRTPERILQEKLPMVYQYLGSNIDGWETRLYGVSAQGADYDKAPEDNGEALPPKKKAKLDKLRDLDAVERISVVHNETKSHDLSEPFAWFLT